MNKYIFSINSILEITLWTEWLLSPVHCFFAFYPTTYLKVPNCLHSLLQAAPFQDTRQLFAAQDTDGEHFLNEKGKL